MKATAIVLDIGLALFTVLVLATDGVSTEPFYVLFTLLLLGVPILSAVVIGRLGAHSGGGSGGGPLSAWLALLCNAALLTQSCWVVATQYASHPKEPGLLPYTIVVLLAPILSLVVLGTHLRRNSARTSPAR